MDREAITPCTAATLDRRRRSRGRARAGPRHHADLIWRAPRGRCVDRVRGLQQLERKLGQPRFERTRSGCLPDELATQLAAYADEMEVARESVRSSIERAPALVAGAVRTTATDTVLHGLVAPALLSLKKTHPLLNFELHTGNELANLTRRDAEVAVRATKRPPPHLVGRNVGSIRLALYAAKQRGAPTWADVQAGRAD